MKYLVTIYFILFLTGCGSAIPTPPPGVLQGPPIPEGVLKTVEDKRSKLASDLADAEAHLAKIKAQMKSLKEETEEKQRQQIRTVLIWISGICMLAAAAMGILCFIPALSFFAPTFSRLILGFGAVGIGAYSTTYVLEYAVYIAIAMGGVLVYGAYVLTKHLHEATVTSNGATKLAEELDYALKSATAELLDPTLKEHLENRIKSSKQEATKLFRKGGAENLVAKLRGKPVKDVT